MVAMTFVDSIRRMVEADLRKAQGEGTRGGNVIGHYPSGAPIYQAKTRGQKIPGGLNKTEHEAAQKAHEKAHAQDIYGNKEQHRGATHEAIYQHASATGSYEKPVGRTRSGAMVQHPYSQKYVALHQKGSDTSRINAMNSRLKYTADDHKDAAEEHRKMARQADKAGDAALAQHHEQTAQAHALAPQKGAVEPTQH